MALYCNQCGTGLPPSARFCSNCGATIAAVPVTPPRPLYRPHAGRAVAGVCIALAQTYGWDVALVRIFTVLGAVFSGGIVVVAYIACWIGIPEEPLVMPSAYPAGTTYPPATNTTYPPRV